MASRLAPMGKGQMVGVQCVCTYIYPCRSVWWPCQMFQTTVKCIPFRLAQKQLALSTDVSHPKT